MVKSCDSFGGDSTFAGKVPMNKMHHQTGCGAEGKVAVPRPLLPDAEWRLPLYPEYAVATAR